jgi:hypothetical protein
MSGQEKNTNEKGFYINSEEVRTMAKSITPSGHFGISADMIQEVEDAVTPEEQEYLLNFAKNNQVWDVTENNYNENGTLIYGANIWKDRVASYRNLQQNDPKVVEILSAIVERLRLKIEDFYNVKVTASGPAVVRWPLGTHQHPHADKEMHDGPDAGKPNNFPWYDLGTVFYLNDDYEGGELFFPLQGIKFKPKARAAYFFPGDKNYIHGVTPVLSNCRYTAPFFWTIKELDVK